MTEEVKGVWQAQNSTIFEVATKYEVANFEKWDDGTFHFFIDAYNHEHTLFLAAAMTAEQFAAFKKWVMEN